LRDGYQSPPKDKYRQPLRDEYRPPVNDDYRAPNRDDYRPPPRGDYNRDDKYSAPTYVDSQRETYRDDSYRPPSYSAASNDPYNHNRGSVRGGENPSFLPRSAVLADDVGVKFTEKDEGEKDKEDSDSVRFGS
jgi:hypothetical protein